MLQSNWLILLQKFNQRIATPEVAGDAHTPRPRKIVLTLLDAEEMTQYKD